MPLMILTTMLIMRRFDRLINVSSTEKACINFVALNERYQNKLICGLFYK